MSKVVEVIKDAVDDIGDFFEDIFDSIVDFVKDVWDEIVMPVLEVVVGLFGIEDETVVSISNVSVRVFDQNGADFLNDAFIRSHLSRARNPSQGALKPFIEQTSEASFKMFNYYDYGVNDYEYELPTTNIRTGTLDNLDIKNAIEAETGESVTILTSKQGSVRESVYFKEYLQNNYSYLPYTNTLTYTDEFGTFDTYSFSNIDYNINDNTYNINIRRDREVIKFYLSGPDTVQSGNFTEIYTVRSDRTVPAGKTIIIPLEYSGTGQNSVTQIPSVTIPSESDSVTFTLESLSNTGGTVLELSLGETILQDSFEIAERSSEYFVATGITSDFNVPNIVNSVVPAPAVVEVNKTIIRPAYPASSYVVATYYTQNPDEWFYWVYDRNTNVYPEIGMQVSTLTELEMMPISIIRTNNTTVQNTETVYDSIKNLIGTLGIDLESLIENIEESPDIALLKETFMLFAVNPSEESEAISKVLFSMFKPLTQSDSGIFNAEEGNDSYLATFEEQNIKRALVWSKQESYFEDRIIGSIGTYNHYIEDVRLFLIRQVTNTECEIIVISDLSAVEFIEAAGLQNTHATKLGEDNFNIPLSFFAINQLSPLEQLELYPHALRINLYAVQITELEWYETEAFADFFQIVIIVVTIFTLGQGTQNLLALAKALAVNYGVSQITLALIAAIDEDIAAAILVIVAIYNPDLAKEVVGQLLSPTQLLNTVTTFADFIAQGIQEDLEDTFKHHEDLINTYTDRIDTITERANEDSSAINVEYLAYLNSPSANIYTAIQSQYDFSAMYNYDTLVGEYHSNALRIGVI